MGHHHGIRPTPLADPTRQHRPETTTGAVVSPPDHATRRRSSLTHAAPQPDSLHPARPGPHLLFENSIAIIPTRWSRFSSVRGPEAFRLKRSRGSSLALLGTSTIGVGRVRPSGRAATGREGSVHRVGRPPGGRASASDRQAGKGASILRWRVVFPRWSRCEPRAAILETACTGAGFGPRWSGCISAQEVSRLRSYRSFAPRPAGSIVGRGTTARSSPRPAPGAG